MQELKEFQREVHAIARSKGWWDGDRNNAEMICLMHAELSEVLEALREPHVMVDKHCPQFLNVEVELADTIIRILDFAEARSLNVVDAMIAKAEVNKNRPVKHGKKF